MNSRNRLQDSREMKIVLISALVIVILLSAITPNVMASQGYWTPSDSYVTPDLKKYHLFLDATFPSSAFRAAHLVNEHLKVCLDFKSTPKPLVCHPIKESDIPSTNNSIMDAGFFVVSSKLNESDASACVAIGYRHMYSCWGGRIESKDQDIKLYYDMTRLIYDDVYAYDACLNDNHLKEGTKDLDECVSELS
ncbi:MAG: hypothetical protein WBQ25_02470 [Nitrososphaeraceae archaeon]